MRSSANNVDDTGKSSTDNSENFSDMDVGAGYDNLDEIIKAASDQHKTAESIIEAKKGDNTVFKLEEPKTVTASGNSPAKKTPSPGPATTDTNSIHKTAEEASPTIVQPISVDTKVPFLCCNVTFKGALDLAGIITLVLTLIPLLVVLIYLKYYQFHQIVLLSECFDIPSPNAITTPIAISPDNFTTEAPDVTIGMTTVTTKGPTSTNYNTSICGEKIMEEGSCRVNKNSFFLQTFIASEVPVAIIGLIVGILLLLCSAFLKKRILVSLALLCTLLGIVACIFSLTVTIGYLFDLSDCMSGHKYWVSPSIILIYVSFIFIWFIFCILLEFNVLRIYFYMTKEAPLPTDSLATTQTN